MVRWKTVSSWVLRFLVLGVAILLPAISMADHVGILDVSPRSFVANKKGQFLFLRGGDGIQNGTEVFFGSLGGPKAKAVPYKNTSWFKVAVPSLPEGPVDLLVNDPATGHQDRLSDHLHPITGDPLSLMFFSGGGNKA